MAQLTIYLSEDLLKEAKERARNEERSLSAWIAELVRRETTGKVWPKSFVELLHQGGGDLVEPDDPPPEDVEAIS